MIKQFVKIGIALLCLSFRTVQLEIPNRGEGLIHLSLSASSSQRDAQIAIKEYLTHMYRYTNIFFKIL